MATAQELKTNREARDEKIKALNAAINKARAALDDLARRSRSAAEANLAAGRRPNCQIAEGEAQRLIDQIGYNAATPIQAIDEAVGTIDQLLG